MTKKRWKRVLTLSLEIAAVLWGIGTLVFMLWEPRVEGRNLHATSFQIYFQDPFLAYAYLSSVPFFVALYHVCKVLRSVGRDQAFSRASVRSLRTIKFCAMATLGLVAVGEVFILSGESDDRAGGVFMGVLVASGSIVTAATAASLERRFRQGALK
jgi:hypothetical protein